ncbi:hypothetical protein GCM10017559_61220 [Streptosporangium longisporum]|uniref:DUF385 domain-containing protein n=1 Tax=Streptosporangium longisporum TaxID=46187 RepID=A0ABP6L3J0_9ACTN
MKQWVMAENTAHAVTIKETPIMMKFMMRLFNPLMRVQVRKGKARSVGGVILLHFTGRKTGKRYEVPVMKQDEDGRLCVYTEARWKVNLRGGADVEVTDMGRRTPMRAELMDDPDAMATEMEGLVRKIGLRRRTSGSASSSTSTACRPARSWPRRSGGATSGSST